MSDDDSTPDGDTEAADEDPAEPTENRRGLSDRAAFWTSAVLALVIAVGSVWLIGVRAVQFEALSRVQPTVAGDGVGTAWIQGNTAPALDWLITLVHFADVILGAFILVIVFIHWIAFRRLAARMRGPGETPAGDREAVATDGGERSSGPRSSSELRSDGGERSEGSRTSEGEQSEPSGSERERSERDPRRAAERSDGDSEARPEGAPRKRERESPASGGNGGESG